MHAAGLSASTCAMSCEQTCPFPQVFLVDAGGGAQRPHQPPSLVPCWSQLPAQGSAARRWKSHGGRRVSTCTALVVLMLFLLVFAGLGLEAYELYRMRKELRQVRGFQQARLRVVVVVDVKVAADVRTWSRLKTWALTVRRDGDGGTSAERTLQVFTRGKV